LENLHKIVFYEILFCLEIQEISDVLDSSSNQLFALFGCRNFILINQRPNNLKHLLTVIPEILSKFEIVQINQADDFSPSFDDLIW